MTINSGGRRRRVPPIGTALAMTLAGCGASGHPNASASAPTKIGASARYFVAVPVPPPAPLPARSSRTPARLEASIEALHRGFAGRMGIAVRAVDAGWTVEAGGRARLPQQSVSKLWVAMTVLDRRDRGLLQLDEPVTVGAGDITLFHQPIAFLAVKPGGYRTTVGDLLDRALTHSDNTANDKLLWLVGGPPAVRAFIERKQLGGIRFGPGERLLQSRTAGLTWRPSYALGNNFEIARSRLTPAARAAALDAYVADPPDGAEPVAVADALARLARGELLSETSTRFLLDTMGASVTGRARMRAALPSGWTIAHKTGTGQDLGARNAGFNDVGLLTAPDGTRYAIAVMIGDSRVPIKERQELIQAVAAQVAAYQASRAGGTGAAN